MKTYSVESAVTFSVRAQDEAEAERKILDLLREMAAGLDSFTRADFLDVKVREQTHAY